jgi:hypothetical protein
VSTITVFDAPVMAGSRFHDPIERMDLANMRLHFYGKPIARRTSVFALAKSATKAASCSKALPITEPEIRPASTSPG